MAQVIYRPSAEHGCPPTTEQFGYSFGASPVEVTDQKHLRKFSGHPFFEVIGGEAAPLSAPPPAPPDPVPQPGPVVLKAVHKGFGRYAVTRGDEDEEVAGGLDKAGAEWFNSLSDEDKAAWLAGNDR